MKMGIHDILRAADVKRWTIVRTVRDQSVAEHTFNVVMIARRLATHLGVDDAVVIKAALEHDLDEIMTGDMPSPVKKKMKEHGYDPVKLENRPDRGDKVNMIIKMADYMESIWFLEENKVGRHANAVLYWIITRKRDMLEHIDPEYAVAYRLVWQEITEGVYTV